MEAGSPASIFAFAPSPPLRWGQYDQCVDSHPVPDPTKLLSEWMEWEKGDETPGRVMGNLKTHGMRDLEGLAAGDSAAASSQ